jgi:hypothetical protein
VLRAGSLADRRIGSNKKENNVNKNNRLNMKKLTL